MLRKGDLSTKISRLLQDFPGTPGIVILDTQDGVSFHHNSQQVFPAASLIKLGILLEYYLQVERGLLDPLERKQLTPNQVVGGTGILQELTPGCRPTLQDLATLMIIVSDNTATNIMIDLLGISNINRAIRTFDLQGTILQRKMFDWEAREEGLENFTTPNDMVRLLQIFLSSERLSSASKAGIIAIMRKQRLSHKLPAQTPPTISWMHKTGELPGAEHDVGILMSGEKKVIVAVLTKELEANEDGLRLIGEIGRIVYDATL